ncbi:hypothetical protein ABZ439_26110 [Streptomyces sp. NPDC005840]
MVLVALLLPLLVALMLFGLDAWENFLFAGRAEKPGTEAERPKERL